MNTRPLTAMLALLIGTAALACPDRSAIAADECTYSHTYLGNLPKEGSPGWHAEAQGAAHDATHWYFSQNSKSALSPTLTYVNPRIWRVPVTHDLADDVTCGKDGVSCITFIQTPLLRADGLELPTGYNHIGDITWARGFLFAAITGHDPEGTTPPAIAVFRGDASLEYVTHMALTPHQRVSYWVGVDPDQGFVYSSDRIEGTHIDTPFLKYQIDWDRFEASQEFVIVGGPWEVSLIDESSALLKLEDLQGGAFADDNGALLYISNGFEHSGPEFGIHLFDVRLRDSDAPCGSAPGPCVATRVAKSTNGSGSFNYEYHPGWSLYQEPEGLTYWDLDVFSNLPGTTDRGNALGGQLHAIMLDNDYYGDDVYFKLSDAGHV